MFYLSCHDLRHRRPTSPQSSTTQFQKTLSRTSSLLKWTGDFGAGVAGCEILNNVQKLLIKPFTVLHIPLVCCCADAAGTSRKAVGCSVNQTKANTASVRLSKGMCQLRKLNPGSRAMGTFKHRRPNRSISRFLSLIPSQLQGLCLAARPEYFSQALF